MKILWSWLNKPTGEWTRFRYLVDAFMNFFLMLCACRIVLLYCPLELQPFILVIVATWGMIYEVHLMLFDLLRRSSKNPSDHSEG